MCGIVGYIGSEQAAPILLDGLTRLEYRGYDSAGVSIHDGHKLNVIKTKGRLRILSDMIDGGNSVHGVSGIGHTRWATHGKPSNENSHPHVSNSGNIAVVHNGIIENYLQLREFLTSRGVKFNSETDTEVVAQLVDYYYDGDLLKAVHRAIDRIEGSYALGIMAAYYPDMIVAACKDSPLIAALSEKGNFIASDVTAVLKHTRDVIYLEDGEYAVLTPESVDVFDSFLEPVEKAVSHIDWDISSAEKGGYEHFMFKEIMEQPEVIRKTMAPRIRNRKVILDDIQLSKEYIKGINKIYIVACGSSYHVGMVAKYNIEKLARKPVEVALASEFRYCTPIVDEKTLVVCISQSGTTADTIAAMREAKRLGGRVLSIVNVVGSTIAKESDDVIYTWAGPEIAVATTKAYSTQLAVTYLLSIYLADCCGTINADEYERLVGELLTIPDKIECILKDKEHIQYLASLYFNNRDIFFIGRNIDYALSLEGSLKLKEISYIHSDAYAAGELKHGTISLVEDGTLVIAAATYQRLLEKTISNIVEVKARAAQVLSVTTESGKGLVAQVSDNMMVIPDIDELFLPSLAVVPMQLFAYYVALLRGCDIDKPRNLAKSVTVE
ncbi:MAG: glutamine--fructose-6-phosphate transaminase (isomerizing) [Clostridiales bacterium]|nr:glutamine--fructose-6-phosphate transaminase (isomerizing) [Clostridiales bacterium]